MSNEVNILVENLQDRIANPKINWSKLQVKGHKLSESKLDDSEIIYELEDEKDFIEYLIPEPAVLLRSMATKDKQITNVELIVLNGGNTSCDGYYIYTDEKYAYFILSQACGQASSLNIWSFLEGKWIFRHGAEGLVPEAVVYSSSKDVFVGYEDWYSYTGSGAGFFIIKNKKLLCQSEVYKSKKIVFEELPLEPGFQEKASHKRKLWSHDNGWLAVSETEDCVYVFIHNQIKKYSLPSLE